MFKSFKTFVLLATMSGLLIVAASYFSNGNSTIVTFMMIFALGMNFFMYFFSHKMAIRAAKAEPIDEAQYPDIVRMVQDLSNRAGQPMPKLYMSPSPQLNAFATGRNPKNGVVCVNSGLYQALTPEELEGVLGHELQHVYNRDILVGTIAAGIATVISYLAVMARWGAMFSGGRDDRQGNNPLVLIVASIVAPIAATVIQLAVTRSRESLADKTGAELTGNPLGLARALAKLEAGSRDPRRLRAGHSPAEANAAMQHMFISAPFGGAMASKMFRSHPPIPDRIEALGEQARAMGLLGPNESVFDRL